VAGVTAHPTGAPAVQQVSNLAMDLRSGALAGSGRFPAPRQLAGCPAAFRFAGSNLRGTHNEIAKLALFTAYGKVATSPR
jgi:hypothetical protein